MMAKYWQTWLRAAALSSVALVCGCSFNSVAAVGKSGTALAEHTYTFDYSADYCRLLAEPVGDMPGTLTCETLDADRETWRRVFRVFSAYGAVLQQAAIRKKVGAKAVVASGLKVADIEALDKPTQGAIAAGLGAIVDLLVQELRRKKIRETLDAANDPIAQIVDETRTNIELSLVNLCTIDGSAKNGARVWGAARCVEGEPGCVFKSNGARMALEHVRVTARRERIQLMELDAELASFAAAHATLDENSEKIGRMADKDLVKQIKAASNEAKAESEAKLAHYEDCGLAPAEETGAEDDEQ